jgi:predicted house-cleaning NTP pyrophosphatase (Maf/HAM1 superfamily)
VLSVQSSVTAFDPWVDAHKKSASVVHVAATAAASAAAVPVVSHAHDEPFSLVAKKSRSKALSTSATTEVPPSVVRPDVVVPIESEPVVKPRKVKKSKPESLSAATVSAASLQTPSFAMVLAPPPSDKSTASVSPAAVSVASTASSDSVIDLWDMSAEELEALRRRQKQMADDDLI